MMQFGSAISGFQLPIEQLAAFADAPFQGNPAAVCWLDAWLPDRLMQAIATENNLSETAFLVGRDGDYQLRWFTPTCEVDLCGHATLAAADVVFRKEPQQTILRFQSRSGPLRVQRDDDRITLDFPAQRAHPCQPPAGLQEAIGASPQHCLLGVDLIAVFADETTIRTLHPHPERVAALPGRGLIATAPGDHVDIVSRFFAPGCGIPEDPVTGSAHCSLTPYWCERLGKSVLNARQLSARGGSLRCTLQGERVLISGRVIPYLSGSIQL